LIIKIVLPKRKKKKGKKERMKYNIPFDHNFNFCLPSSNSCNSDQNEVGKGDYKYFNVYMLSHEMREEKTKQIRENLK